MTTEHREILVRGIPVQIVRKRIKHVHLGVYPPAGRVRVAVPMAVSDDAVRLAVIGRLGWIQKQRARFDAQPRQSRREMVGGESHYYLGRRFRLRVVERDAPASVVQRGNALVLTAPASIGSDARARVLQRWYREGLKALIPPLLDKWQPRADVWVAEWGVRKMRTKWGSCTPGARRIWLNLELAKKPVACIEFVLVHELVHLMERHHNERFLAHMDRLMPDWRSRRQELNAAPLAHEEWTY